MSVVFFDFDGVYQMRPPNSNIVVLTNKYHADWAIDINRVTDSRISAYERFEKYIAAVSKTSDKYNKDVFSNKILLFNNFFFPLSQWIYIIDSLIDEGKISDSTKFEFSSYANNPFVFLLEAEGETNRQLLYSKSYFLSFYIVSFLKGKGYRNFGFNKTHTLITKWSFWLRGFLMLNVKFVQLMLYKLLIVKRLYNVPKKNHSDFDFVLSTRGIIQSQFLRGFYEENKSRSLIIVNESSSFPLRNLNISKKYFSSFVYAEGCIPFRNLLSEYFSVIRAYIIAEFRNGFKSSDYYGITVSINHVLPELFLRNFQIKTYAVSFNSIIERLKKDNSLTYKKVISFEMLPPYAFYLDQKLQEPVVQIQTTLMSAVKSPTYVHSDRFYFNSFDAYKSHLEVNDHFSDKLDYLNNIKFMGTQKKGRIKEVRGITYFTQPIYFSEEKNIILFLKEFCTVNKITFRIKLHPRSKLPDCDLTSVVILDPKMSAEDAILEADLVVTRNSSMGLDCWSLNVPAVFFVNGTLTNEGISFIPDDYSGTIKEDISQSKFSELVNSIPGSFYNHPFHTNFSVNKVEILEKLLSNQS